MKTTQQLFTAKDHLVSKDRFKVIWNNDKHWAQTEIPLGTDMSKYYKSDDYASHKNKEKSLADFIYIFIQKPYTKEFIFMPTFDKYCGYKPSIDTLMLSFQLNITFSRLYL